MQTTPSKKIKDSKTTTPILSLDNVSISFGDFNAIQHVSTTVKDHEIRFFIGPNGAGKTTILDAICGKIKISSGAINYFDNNQTYNIERMKDYDIFRHGISRKFQAPSIFNGLTVYENIGITASQHRSVFNSLHAKFSGEQKDAIEDILTFIGLADLKDQFPMVLSHGQKQWLEIGILMASNPRLILLDEPVAGMGRKETQKTEELLLKLRQRCTIISVEHDMQFCQDISDSVTVFHEGQVLDEGSFDKVQQNPKVIDVYLGRSED